MTLQTLKDSSKDNTTGCYPGCYYYGDSCFRSDCKQKPQPSEKDEIVGSLPKYKWSEGYLPALKQAPNAWVLVDEKGQVVIFPLEGGALWCNPEHLTGDAAPFCD